MNVYEKDYVTKEDFTELKDIVKELAEAQKELAEAQKRTELRVEELAEAQKETQKEIRELALNMRYTRRDLRGITSTLGFMLENEAYRVLPDILKERYAIEVKERFLPKSIRSFGIDEEAEANIFYRCGVDRN